MNRQLVALAALAMTAGYSTRPRFVWHRTRGPMGAEERIGSKSGVRAFRRDGTYQNTYEDVQRFLAARRKAKAGM